MYSKKGSFFIFLQKILQLDFQIVGIKVTSQPTCINPFFFFKDGVKIIKRWSGTALFEKKTAFSTLRLQIGKQL